MQHSAPTLHRALLELRGPRYASPRRILCAQCIRRFAFQAEGRNRRIYNLGRRTTHLPEKWRGSQQARALATVSHSNSDMWGPLEEYDERVHLRQLREDEHQRSIVHMLQDLHDMLKDYRTPKVIHPSIESLKTPKRSFISSLFYPKSPLKRTKLPENLPKGLYMFGDVGSGKTMLMDLFYDTLPGNVTSKTRIHFHNFMQDVHKRLHAMKMEHGTDLDAVKYIAADIAEKANVLCFDEFQCTDVADAMILRR